MRKEPEFSPAESLRVKGELTPRTNLSHSSWALGIITKLAESDPDLSPTGKEGQKMGRATPLTDSQGSSVGTEAPESGADASVIVRVGMGE